MSTSERWVHYKVSCPCGAGEIQRVVIEYHNMWSGDDHVAETTCAACHARYEVELATVSLANQTGARFVLTEREQKRRSHIAWTAFRELDGKFKVEFCEPLAASIEAYARLHGRSVVKWAAGLSGVLGQPAIELEHSIRAAQNFTSWCLALVTDRSYPTLAVAFLDERAASARSPLAALQAARSKWEEASVIKLHWPPQAESGDSA